MLDADGTRVSPRDAVLALGLCGAALGEFSDDIVTAADHGTATARQRAHVDLALRPGRLLEGERLAATRGRPFHPTSQAVSGWSVSDILTYGPMRREPLALAWVAVRRSQLRLGPEPISGSIHQQLLSRADQTVLENEMASAGVDGTDYQLLPVHPWQAINVLPELYAAAYTRREIVPISADLGEFHPTVSLRTLITTVAPQHHVKLPLAVATLGATRLLPVRNRENGVRNERTMRAIIESDTRLHALVDVCAEGAWVGWDESSVRDPSLEREGHLAAQVRTYPANTHADFAVPMAALAAHEWSSLAMSIGMTDPVEWFGALADVFAVITLAFLSRGVFPELHGQNTVLRMSLQGRILGFVLRDHDALRVNEGWMKAAGTLDPQQIIRPGRSQSLRPDSPEDLVGYAQTLAFQVNLNGIAVALARHYALDERELWSCVRRAIERALSALDLPRAVSDVLADCFLRAPMWPSRTVMRPLLESGRSLALSMPAGTGSIPNPLRQ
ncbi:IucA/IucC family protein [Rhodococcus sp. NPDC060176]|uniref:IucA/IucC family protein n=1 Tax=Rhodococcus sp. NPDC060176 TaxID=3347062 RepID=UPI0036535B6C